MQPEHPPDKPAGEEPDNCDPPNPFPKGIEGTRGDKDSAHRAREFYRQRRGLDEDPPEEEKNDHSPNDQSHENERSKSEKK